MINDYIALTVAAFEVQLSEMTISTLHYPHPTAKFHHRKNLNEPARQKRAMKCKKTLARTIFSSRFLSVCVIAVS